MMDKPENEHPTPTGDLADRHAKTAEPHQTPVPGAEAESAAEHALGGTPLSRRDVLNQASYKGTEVDVGQQAATAERAEKDRERASHSHVERTPTKTE